MHDQRAAAAANHSLATPTTDPPRRPKTSANADSAREASDAICASAWIIRYHDIWSRLTLSTFYKDLAERSLTQAQYFRWLLDRTSVSIAVVKAATRTNEMLRMAMPSMQGDLPLLCAARDDAHFLAQYAEMSGFDICSEYRLSHAARRLVEFIDASTAPDAPLPVAITAVWTYMLASWTAWALCLNRRERTGPIPPHFKAIGQFLSRQSSISLLSDTQELLDQLLRTETGVESFDKAGKAFEEVARRAGAVLDHTLYMADGNQVPLCTCGRKGHSPEQCTFKSHF